MTISTVRCVGSICPNGSDKCCSVCERINVCEYICNYVKELFVPCSADAIIETEEK